MPGNDFITYQNKVTHAQQTKTSLQALITLERAQKFDLLLHLISNLSQSLVVCGPYGIGKTKLLETLLETGRNEWTICMLSASSELSFEKVLAELRRHLTQQKTSYSGQDLSDLLSAYEKDKRKIVLVIDDAGLLVPGLISALIQFANANNCLRLVLSMTHDELHIKSSSDTIIDECHFIELPPLNKKQYMTYLQNLSAQQGACISFHAVTEGLIENLYSVTHGIPGKILEELPRLSEYQAKPGGKWSLFSLLLAVFFISGLVFYFYGADDQPKTSTLSEPLIRDKVSDVDIVAPFIDVTEVDSERAVKDMPFDSNDMKNHSAVVMDAKDGDLFADEESESSSVEDEFSQIKVQNVETRANSLAEEESIENKPEEKEKIIKNEPSTTEQKMRTIEVEPSTNNETDDTSWLIKQNALHYTMQLMVLSQRQSVLDFIQKNHDYRALIKFFKLTDKQGHDKYVLVYGIFASTADAITAKKKLPAVFQKAWLRKIQNLQQQIAAQ